MSFFATLSSISLLAVAHAAVPTPQSSAGLPPRWIPTFGGALGVDLAVYSSEVFDDGSGPALYLGGLFSTAGAVEVANIARWDGSSWSSLGLGVDGQVNAMAVHDDGSGAALFVGGRFTSAGGAAAAHVARWDGVGWTELGSGTDGEVLALFSHDDGSGPALYAGGSFYSAGGVVVNHVARWNGTSWEPVGNGLPGLPGDSVLTFTEYDEGSGSVLMAGGDFKSTATFAIDRVARWDGNAWTGVGGPGTNGTIRKLGVYDAGSGAGSVLVVGGTFTTVSGLPANCIATWDGATWSDMGGGVSVGSFAPEIQAMEVFDDGLGPSLFIGGRFDHAGGVAAGNVARWDGTTWSAAAPGTSVQVFSFSTFNDGVHGPELYAGGYVPNGVVKWGPGETEWQPLGSGLDGALLALAVYDDGSGMGSGLYAAGGLNNVGSLKTGGIARWDGSGWSDLGGGLDAYVTSLQVHDDGTGPALFAGGYFSTQIGGVSLNRVAKWEGVAWSAVGSGPSDGVNCLAVHDDGSGEALYAGTGNTPIKRVEQWDGTAWSSLGAQFAGDVEALVSYDDGTGPALYAGGGFRMIGNVPVSGLARWNGSAWQQAGGSVSPDVTSLTVLDAGSGPALYVGGDGTLVVNGLNAHSLSKWDGTSWTLLSGGPTMDVYDVAHYDDGTGSGPTLYATGSFATAGSSVVNGIARWDGFSWHPLGTGLGGPNPIGLALQVYDAGDGPSLFVGGFFESSPGGDSYLARWGGCSGIETYCTSGTSGSGCQAQISATGIPSVTAGSGFDLVVDHAEAGVGGLFYFSTNGRQANPWGNGTSYQCVAPPIHRTGTLIGSGTPGMCEGVFVKDLATHWQTKPNVNPGPGVAVQAQLWYLDPLSTSNRPDGFSNALEFCTQP